MVQTFVLENVTTVDEVKTFQEDTFTTLVETVTPISNVATGEYEADNELTYSLYNLGQIYFARIKWTPVGGVQETSPALPFIIVPQGQKGAAASVTDTSCGEGTHLQAPILTLRLGLGSFREQDFENFTTANARSRHTLEFPLPDDRSASFIHMLFANGRAGEPWSPFVVSGTRNTFGPFATAEEAPENEPFNITFPTKGYRSSAVASDYFLRQSRNFTIHTDVPRTRPGYLIRRQFTQAVATYLERIQVDQSNGTLRTAIQVGTTIFEDSASPTSRDATLTNPYAADVNKVPQSVYVLGRNIRVDGTDANARVLFHNGTQLFVKEFFADAGTPTLLASGAGSPLTQQQWFVRVRFYDDQTRTWSGPSQRTATAVDVTPAGGQAIRVTMPTAPTRATHWQVQAATLDTPSSYQIDYTPVDGVGGTLVGDSTGRIPVATTQAFIDTDPASSDQFHFRTVGAITVYRHGIVPTGATFVVHFQGRVFYASDVDTYLVWSEADEDGFGEQFYNNPTSPHEGFNTVKGESLVDAVMSPCTALGATEFSLLYFMRSGIVIGEGTFIFDNGVRDARFNILSQNTSGSISPAIQDVDYDAFFISQEGPKVYQAGGVIDLDTQAIREDWECRDPVFDHRAHIGFHPKYRLVIFSFVSKNAPIAGFPDVHLAWHIDKRQWCPPWDLDVSSWTLHRFNTDAGVIRGTRLMFGGPYGSMGEFGVGDGDGQDGSVAADSDDLTSTSHTTTTVDVSGSGWTVNAFRGYGLFLQDRTTGRTYYRTIISNDSDTLVWEGAITNSGGGWLINIGGIRKQYHVLEVVTGVEQTFQRLALHHQDVISLEA